MKYEISGWWDPETLRGIAEDEQLLDEVFRGVHFARPVIVKLQRRLRRIATATENRNKFFRAPPQLRRHK